MSKVRHIETHGFPVEKGGVTGSGAYRERITGQFQGNLPHKEGVPHSPSQHAATLANGVTRRVTALWGRGRPACACGTRAGKPGSGLADPGTRKLCVLWLFARSDSSRVNDTTSSGLLKTSRRRAARPSPGAATCPSAPLPGPALVPFTLPVPDIAERRSCRQGIPMLGQHS